MNHYFKYSFITIMGRLIQGLSAACIMPATLSIIESYYIGKDRQRAFKLLVNWLMGRLWCLFIFGGAGCNTFRLALDFHLINYNFINCAVFLFKGTPETKSKSISLNKFDIKGLVF